jgi:signal transduction histidine kinase
MVLNTDLEPPYLTKIAMYSLMVVITIVALAIYIGVAFAVSRSISAPIESMSKKAKSLSLYDYDVTFDEKGPQEIRELAEALNSSTQELKKLSATQKELIANISHDLRTPLTMISGYSEVMRDFPDERTPENMQIVIDETERLTDLVNDLLDLSRVQSGARRAVIEPFDLTETIRSTLERYHKLTQHDGYTITFENETGKSATVLADRGMILQVVYNLINNAINYCGEDRVVLVRQLRVGDRIRLEVVDHGEGIAPEQIGEIWNRYYKIDRVHRRAMVGTGLGLSIVKEILDQHGFDFGVESTVGLGSVFWFELPVVLGDIADAEDEHTIIGETIDL